MKVFIAFILSTNTFLASADYLIISKRTQVYSEPSSKAGPLTFADAGTRLELIDNGNQTNGFYHVANDVLHIKGWVPRTLVRRYAGAHFNSTMPDQIAFLESHVALKARVDTLERDLTVFRDMINPEVAEKMLSYSILLKEQEARKAFEAKIDEKITKVEAHVDDNNDSVDEVQFWIWGIMATLIAGMVGLILFLAKRVNALLLEKERVEVDA